MAATSSKSMVPRKRNRKRRRRAASSSSSSDSDSDASESSFPKPVPLANVQLPVAEPSGSEESSSDSCSDSDSDAELVKSGVHIKSLSDAVDVEPTPRRSPSPTPPPSTIPAFLPQEPNHDQTEQELKARFRKFWMTSVADAFKNDLEEIRKEPNLTTSRLSLLVDALASGGDVFASHAEGANDINEMEVVLESQHDD